MNEKQKQTLIEYMMKYCGDSYRNALMKFEKWANDRLEVEHKERKCLVSDNKEMTNKQITSLVLYLSRRGFSNKYISELFGINCQRVDKIMMNYRKNIARKH